MQCGNRNHGTRRLPGSAPTGIDRVERWPVRDVGRIHAYLNELVNAGAGTVQRCLDVRQRLADLLFEWRIHKPYAIPRDRKLAGHKDEVPGDLAWL